MILVLAILLLVVSILGYTGARNSRLWERRCRSARAMCYRLVDERDAALHQRDIAWDALYPHRAGKPGASP